ncbi:MAG: hypothetical protein JNJ56_03370 [Ignavibacteria bacterium]|nr:hypothetical protein [Ignavibacteria bacterium]
MIKSFLIVTILCSCTGFCQEKSKSRSLIYSGNRSFKISYPLYEIHAGLGILNGGNIGGRIRLNEQTGFEVSYGRDIIFSTGNNTNYYCAGLNVYTSSYSSFVISLIGAYKKNNSKSSGIISPNAGYVHYGKKGITIQARGGLQFYLNKDYNMEDYGLSMITFDFSIGKSF